MPILKKNEKGQSTIEFILTLSFAIGITMLFVSQALNMTVGFMVHYGTFMAGRTFLSHDSFGRDISQSIGQAGNVAKETFSFYNLQVLDISPVVKIVKPSDGNSLMSGVTAQYDKLLSPFKLILNGEKATFYSEGFLGKEPTRASCYQQTCFAIGSGGNCTANMDVTLFDNGC